MESIKPLPFLLKDDLLSKGFIAKHLSGMIAHLPRRVIDLDPNPLLCRRLHKSLHPLRFDKGIVDIRMQIIAMVDVHIIQAMLLRLFQMPILVALHGVAMIIAHGKMLLVINWLVGREKEFIAKNPALSLF